MTSYPAYVSDAHCGVSDGEAFQAGIDQALRALSQDNGIFVGDNLITFGRNLGFLDDLPFLAAWRSNADNPSDRAILWRTANVIWAARHAKRLGGDFAEFGVYRGYTARMILDLVDISDRKFWLYDAFLPIDGQTVLPGVHDGLEGEVRRRLEAFPNIEVVSGIVPESFAKGLPERVAFAHIDMNNAVPEIAALEMLEHRLVPGAAIVLDDYGWLIYRAQFVAERKWFADRGRSVMEMPTGQGLVIW